MDLRYVEEGKRFISRAVNVLAVKRKLLYFSLLLSKVRIYYVPGMQQVACSGPFEIILSDNFFKLDDQMKLKVLVHELLHITLRHSDRVVRYVTTASRKYPKLTREEIKLIYNMIADYYIDGYLNPFSMSKFKYFKDFMEISFDRILLFRWKPGAAVLIDSARQSVEDMVEAVLKEIHKEDEDTPSGGSPFKHRFITDEEFSGDILEPGENAEEGMVIREGAQPAPKNEDEIIREIMKASRMAGTLPGNLKEEIEKFSKAVLPWKRFIRETFAHSIRSIRRTFTRPNRRYDWLPRYTIEFGGKAVILIDTSGSISKEELEQFLGEVYECLKYGEAVVITWDTKVHDVFELKSRNDITKVEIRGRGGTSIKEALEKAKEYTDPSATTVVLSDFYISESDSQLEELLKQIPGKKILATTQRVPFIDPAAASVFQISLKS